MKLNTLVINGFRNYEHETLSTNSEINVIYGKNGQGKTSLLEALYYSILTQSFKTKQDRDCLNYKLDQKFFDIESVFTNSLGLQDEVKLHFDRKSGKSLFVNNDKVTPLKEHVGFIPSVLLKPDDSELSFGGPSERRRFLDLLLSQLSPRYLDCLIRYRRVIKQKNSLLQQVDLDRKQLEVWNEAIVKYASVLIEKRFEMIELLSQETKDAYQRLSSEDEKAEISYLSIVKSSDTIEPELRKRLAEQGENEVQQRKSLVGPHRDDMNFLLNGKLVGRYGSQGENKTFLISLKLAELHILKAQKKEKAILLLDDIFSELDTHRITQLMKEAKDLGQLFITTTTKDLVRDREAAYFKIENGTITS